VRSTNYEAPHYVIFSNLLSFPSLFTLFSDTLSLCTSLNARDQVPHPYKATGIRYRLVVNSERCIRKWLWPVLSKHTPAEIREDNEKCLQEPRIELESLRTRSPTLQHLYSHLVNLLWLKLRIRVQLVRYKPPLYSDIYSQIQKHFSVADLSEAYVFVVMCVKQWAGIV
jgi:hypothetical protein